MVEETQENIVQSETPVAEVAGVDSTKPVVEETTGSKWAGMSKVDPENAVDPVENNTSSETDIAPISKWAGMGDSAEAAGYKDPTIIRDKEVEIDLEDYTSYLGNDIYNPVGGIEALNKSRAKNQSWYAQAGNMLGQAVVGEIVGGSIEGLGYVLDVAGWADIAKGEEGEWGNWLSDMGKDLREAGQEAMPIYQVNEGEFDMADSGWWFSNAVSVASSLSMMIPATGTVKALSFLGKGVSRALSAINKVDDIAANMGKRAKWMSNGISQAVVSRHIENHMEASGTFESTKAEFLNSIDPTTGLKFTEEDAKKYASDAAASNYKLGWAMIMQDIPQYLAIGKVFNPRTMKMESALKKASTKGKNVKIKPWQSKAVAASKAGGVTFLSEGAEESYQYYIAERGALKAKLDAGLINEDEYEEELAATIGDTEMMTSAFWGGLGGNIFQAVGPKTQSLFKSKATRESEANWAKMQTDFLEKRGKSYEAMQKELAIADQMGDPTRRKQIINEMMIGMSLEALTLDKFEQHLESLASLAEMTKEEQDAYKKEQGIELDIELFKEYVPAAIDIANRTRKSFLKHMDKHDTNVSVLMANNDIHIEQFQERIDALGKEQAEMSDAFAGTSKMSAYATEIPRKKALIKAYQRANDIHRANLSSKATKQKKASVEAAIKSNEEYIASLENELANDYKTKEDIHPEKRMHNRRYKAGYQTMLDDQFSKQVEKILLEDGISLKQADNAHMGTDAYKKEQNLRRTEAKVASITTVEDADAVIKNIENNNDLTAKEKSSITSKVKKKKNAILKKKKEQELKIAQEKHDKLRAEEAAKKQEENPENLVAKNVAPIDDQVEDEFFEEESNHVDPVLDRSDAAVDASAETNKEVKLLDTVASESYNEWVNNTKSKTDQEVDFEISDYTGENKNILEAIRLFNSGVVNNFVYEYLPIKVLIGGNPDVFTFLPTLTENIASSPKAFNMWNKIDLPQRKIIIDLIKSGKPAKSQIGKTTGGDLIMDTNEDGSPASNVITDLEQNQGKGIGDLDIAITNATGDLVDNRTRELVKGHEGKKYMVTGVTDENGNEIPYKGGVFLMVKKADGKSFPLRLNLSRHSIYQADALAEVMSLVMLGKIKLENSIEDLPADLITYMQENLPAEMDVVEDGSIKDFLNILGYVSENTKGMKSELMFSPDFKSILFGNGKVMNEANLSTAREELMDFLQTKKNVQFNSALFASSPKYRAWVVNSGVISTNATTKGPMFKRSNNRPTKVFVKPILGDKPKPSVKRKAKESKDVPGQVERKDKSKRAGITKGEQGIPGFTGYYYNEKGGVVAVNAPTKKEVQSMLDAKYSSEDISVKVTSKTSQENSDANRKDRLKRSKSSVEKSTMGLPGFEGIYYAPDGKTLAVNLPTKKQVNEWIDKKFNAEPKTNPVSKTTPTQQTGEVGSFTKIEGGYTLEQKTLKGGIVNQIITNNENGSEIIKATKPDGSIKFFATGKFEGVPGSMNGLATSQKEIDAVLGQLGVEAKNFLTTEVVLPTPQADISDLEKRDKIEDSVEKKSETSSNLRKRRRKKSIKNKTEKKLPKDLDGLNIFSNFANENASSIDSMNTISDVNPGKDKGTINKKCE